MVTLVQCALLIAPYRSPARGGGWLPWCNALRLLHPTPLPQGERELLPWCNALRLLHPTPLPLGRGDCYRGRLRFANRPYSTLLVPGPSETPSRVEPSHLAEARDAGLASANDATAPGSRYHNAPLTRRDKTGANGHPPHPTEPTGPDPWILLTQVSESTGFLRWFKVMAPRPGWGGAIGPGGGAPKCERGGISPAYPFLALVWRAPGWLRWSPITCR
ncbi:hypothetical protein D3C84_316730 [compost metagenome]